MVFARRHRVQAPVVMLPVERALLIRAAGLAKVMIDQLERLIA